MYIYIFIHLIFLFTFMLFIVLCLIHVTATTKFKQINKLRDVMQYYTFNQNKMKGRLINLFKNVD